MNIFIIFFVKEKKKSYYPSIFILKCEINRKIDMAAKKCYYLFYLNQIEFKVLFFLTNQYFLSLSSWTKNQEALVLRQYYERLKTDEKTCY